MNSRTEAAIQELRAHWDRSPVNSGADWFLQRDREKLHTSVDAFRAARANHPQDAEILIDLSAALLGLWKQAGTGGSSGSPKQHEGPDDFLLIEALEAVSEALQITRLSRQAPALLGPAYFNLALILDGLGWDGAAVRAWSEATRAEPSSSWNRIASQRLDRAKGRRAKGLSGPIADRDLRRYLKLGLPKDFQLEPANEPYLRRALEDVLPCALLREVARAQRQADPNLTCVGLGKLRRLADQVRVHTEDELVEEVLANAPAAINAATDTGRARWSGALSALWWGKTFTRRGAEKKAVESLQRAVTDLRPLSLPLALSAEVALQDIRLRLRPVPPDTFPGRLAAVQDLRGRIPPKFSELRARALLIEGLLLGKNLQYDASAKAYEKSKLAYERLGEPHRVAVLQFNESELQALTGRWKKAWQQWATCLRGAYRYGDTHRIHNTFVEARGAAIEAGWEPLAAFLDGILDLEDSSPQDRIETLTFRARGLLDADAFPTAAPFLRQAEGELRRLSPDSQSWLPFHCDLLSLNATLEAGLNPGDSVNGLEQQLKGECPGDYPVGRADDLFRKALASHLRGDLPGTLEAGRASVAQVFLGMQRLETLGDRKAIFEQHRPKLDHLLDWLREADRAKEGLDWVLRAYEAEKGLHKRLIGAPRLEPEEGQSVLVLYSLRTSTLGWLVTAQETTPFEIHIDRQGLLDLHPQLSLQFESAQRAGGSRGRLDRMLDALSVKILTEISDELSGLDRLIILASPELRGLPFSALRRPNAGKTGRYLGEELALSLAVPAGGTTGAQDEIRLSAGEERLVVSEVRNIKAIEDGIPTLSSSTKEAEIVAAAFPHGVSLRGVEAPQSAVLSALKKATLAHFATHAMSGPAGVRLVLSLTSTMPSKEGYLGGADLEKLSLPHLQVVNLAACRSAEPGNPAGQTDGLVEPFLAAGARSVIANPWPVVDQLSPQIWSFFYDHLRAGASPAEALRQARSKCIHSPSNLANPAFWAGFAVYHGDLPLKGD